MDLEPFVVASALRLVVAQRLVRRLCPACRVPVPLQSDRGRTLLRALSPASRRMLDGAAAIQEAGGCPACSGTGFRGRTGLFEVLRITPRIEELIVQRATATTIRNQARAEGMCTLREAGLRKVALGETTLAEVLEQTVADADEAIVPAEGNTVHV
jgi:type II secretory ATPase GspE/PulE/Tfp pilus assembly ATPase PilB-like protein